MAPVLGQHRVVDLGDPLVLEHVVEDTFLVDRVVPLDRLVDHHEEETVQRLRKEELETIVGVHRQPGNSISVLQWISREQMLAANDLRSILNAAEQAVAREDATAAEQLLREALALQESTAGSPRDEIAKTLNNLAVVCEMTGKLKDAETCYRRAHKIAMASLPASDPFVTTSRENLEAFCTVARHSARAGAAARTTSRCRGGACTCTCACACSCSASRGAADADGRCARASRCSHRAPRVPRPDRRRRLLTSVSCATASTTATAVPAKTPRGPSRVVIVGRRCSSCGRHRDRDRAQLARAPSAAERAETISQSEPVASVPPVGGRAAPTPSPGSTTCARGLSPSRSRPRRVRPHRHPNLRARRRPPQR